MFEHDQGKCIMPHNAPRNMTEQQRKWFASVRDGSQRETGKSLVEWVAIAKTCPETGTRAWLKWFKEALALPDVIASQREGFTAWSRTHQFAALRPVRGGTARLGLALPADAHDSLLPAKNEGWSERLKTALVLQSPRAAYRGFQRCN
jgi:hypothetical protein